MKRSRANTDSVPSSHSAFSYTLLACARPGAFFAVLALLAAVWLRPHVVFTRSATVALVSAGLFGFTTVFELHDPIGSLSRRQRQRLAKLIGLEAFRMLVVTSQRLRDDSIRLFPQHAGKFLIAPNGADPVPPNVEPCSLSGTFKVGYVGHLHGDNKRYCASMRLGDISHRRGNTRRY